MISPPATAGGTDPLLTATLKFDVERHGSPLAYLITFRCYGTWLHGDERGSINRFNNQYNSPYIAANQNRQRYNAEKVKSEVAILDDAQRQCVENAVRETCDFRHWHLQAVNVRTNHAHVVAAGAVKPELMLNAFKANATRQLRENGFWQFKHSPWANKGSGRFLWNERSVERAIEYVVNGQGDSLPDCI